VREDVEVQLVEDLQMGQLLVAEVLAERREGRDKVTGRARYAYEYPAEDIAYAASRCRGSAV
jgi:hypothetical protein